MQKNIVICADGTGNTTIKGRGTNVFKIFEAVDTSEPRSKQPRPQQAAIYHDGVGTESLKWLRLLTGAGGWGLSRNVKQLYGELARVYVPGDRIFLFGFSRGAFTVRTLAGLITTCGILDVSRPEYSTNELFWRGIRAAYAAYRKKYQTRLSLWLRGKLTPDPDALRRQFSVEIPGFTYPNEPVIHFIGVWDTVDAVGLPFRLADLINEFIWRFKFPDTSLSAHVGAACHALAADEARESFRPLLWDESAENPANPRIQQVWFAGVHSNVGGGYPRQGMSLVALDWMMAEPSGMASASTPISAGSITAPPTSTTRPTTHAAASASSTGGSRGTSRRCPRSAASRRKSIGRSSIAFRGAPKDTRQERCHPTAASSAPPPPPSRWR